jgi:hypothetical protein
MQLRLVIGREKRVGIGVNTDENEFMRSGIATVMHVSAKGLEGSF